MSEYQITCCSTADMPAQYFEEKKIPFVCFNFLMDGVQYPDDLGKSMPFKEFYKKNRRWGRTYHGSGKYSAVYGIV